jgi:hypothetical protein
MNYRAVGILSQMFEWVDGMIVFVIFKVFLSEVQILYHPISHMQRL